MCAMVAMWMAVAVGLVLDSSFTSVSTLLSKSMGKQWITLQKHLQRDPHKTHIHKKSFSDFVEFVLKILPKVDRVLVVSKVMFEAKSYLEIL